MNVLALQNLHTLAVNGFALFVHYLVILQRVLSYTEVSALYRPLRVFHASCKHFALQTLVVIYFEHVVKLFHAFAAETLCKVVLKRNKENGIAGVALTPRTSAELIIDTAGFVALGTEYAKSARLYNLLLFRVRFLFVICVQLGIARAGSLFFFRKLSVRVGDCNLYHFVVVALLAHTLFGKIFGVAAQKNIRSAARHVGCDCNRVKSARLRDDFRLALVVFCVQYVVLNAVSA